jgi:membrane protein
MSGLFRNLKGQIRAWSKGRGEIQDRLRYFYLKLNKRLGGALGVLRHALNNFNLVHAAEASASLAYYGLFSIFPLLLAVVSIGSMFLEGELVKVELLEIINQWIPISADAVNSQITTVLNLRGPVTIVAIISLLWSGSNVFEKVIVNVNRAFPQGSRPGFFKSRGMALLIIVVMILLFGASMVFSTVVEIFPSAENALFGKLITSAKAWVEVLQIAPLVLKFFLFLAVYSWIPQSASILFKARLIGALVTAVSWELSSRLLGWAISSGFTNYEIIYGSLASIMALMFWLYLSSYILFFGAHLVHAIDTQIKRKQSGAGKEENQAGGAAI